MGPKFRASFLLAIIAFINSFALPQEDKSAAKHPKLGLVLEGSSRLPDAEGPGLLRPARRALFRQALAGGTPVVVGVDINDAFDNYKRGGIWTDGSGIVDGPEVSRGHALCLVGIPSPLNPTPRGEKHCGFHRRSHSRKVPRRVHHQLVS